MKHPEFSQIQSYEEFSRYYWYRKELSQIFRQLGLAHTGTKQELNGVIAAYFRGTKVKPSRHKLPPKQSSVALDSPLLSCGFSFNQAFRDYFARQTGIHPFKFTADMAAWRKVKADNDTNFTIQDMLDIYYGKKNPDYAPYDNRACQWNQFYKDFCADPQNRSRKNKIQKAAILWQEIKKTDRAKVYSSDLLLTYQQLL